jgi:hypothetical protein
MLSLGSFLFASVPAAVAFVLVPDGSQRPVVTAG